ncbi:ABC transporter substrate-binding protein [soil metagenome]
MKKCTTTVALRMMALGVLILILVACVPATTPATTGSDPAATKPSGRLVISTAANQILLDPTTTTANNDIMLHLNLYELLYRVNRDGTELEPSAAKSYETSPDLKTWTFHLRDDLKFSDGTPLTAEDVVYSIERGRRKESLWGWIYDDAGLESVKAPDDKTVVFTLTKSFVPFLSDVAGYWAAIFPKAALEKQGDAFFDKPISSGPFMVKDMVQGEHITLVRNPNALVPPILDEVEITLIPDDNTRILKLQSGDIDVAVDVPASQIDAVNAVPELTVESFPFAFASALTLNHAKAPLDDLNFRLALNYAVDREAIIKAVLFGHGEPATSFLPKGVMYWDETVPGFKYDLEKAKDYLAKSKYASGAEFEIWTTPTSVTGNATATALQGMWSKLPGVTVKIVQLESGVLTDRRNKGEHWITVGGFSSDVVDPDEITNWFVTGYVHQFTNADISGVQPLIAQAQVEPDAAKRKQMYGEVQHWVWENAYTVSLYYTANNWGVSKKVRDLWVDPVMGLRLQEVSIAQ